MSFFNIPFPSLFPRPWNVVLKHVSALRPLPQFIKENPLRYSLAVALGIARTNEYSSRRTENREACSSNGSFVTVAPCHGTLSPQGWILWMSYR
ncbi:hypothetical protein M378DRAFT_853770 [Amanita muscaria Koide BX008]|uniref:Uncharacterized protein n=1 Tax=Amanita muscaria (strain Koide BX008) TaxID=946122 RepID=A0A0C2SER2_AMAMK|nr:hypothetical protein M378DRAFT_853770 [Amanita muscaria Koide BX008]